MVKSYPHLSLKNPGIDYSTSLFDMEEMMNEQGEKAYFKKRNPVSLAIPLILAAVLSPVALACLVVYAVVWVIRRALVTVMDFVLNGVGAIHNTFYYDLRRNWGIVMGKNLTCTICHQAEKGKEEVDLSPCCMRWVHPSCHELDTLKERERLAKQMSEGIVMKVRLGP
jgi:hypothetical protein